jgi:hypothetical protein
MKYFSKITNTDIKNNNNPDICSICSKPASVYPFAHRPKVYVIPELNSPIKNIVKTVIINLLKKITKSLVKKRLYHFKGG